eukprot:752167-Hanusia_phi.AAC.3
MWKTLKTVRGNEADWGCAVVSCGYRRNQEQTSTAMHECCTHVLHSRTKLDDSGRLKIIKEVKKAGTFVQTDIRQSFWQMIKRKEEKGGAMLEEERRSGGKTRRAERRGGAGGRRAELKSRAEGPR